MKTFKTVSTALLLTAVHAGTVSADEYNGSLTAGGPLQGNIGASVTDMLQVTCFNDPTLSQLPTDHLFISIRDNTAGVGLVSAAAIWGNKAVTVTDTVGGDGGTSPVRRLKLTTPAQNAVFTVVINHTHAGAENYLLSFHCEDANNNHTGTSLTILQNQ
jgi:hypothetical protein